MIRRELKFRVVTPVGILGILIACSSGIDLARSWHKHDHHTLGEGVFFALALVLMFVCITSFKVRASHPLGERTPIPKPVLEPDTEEDSVQ
jgi:hypothetical protein